MNYLEVHMWVVWAVWIVWVRMELLSPRSRGGVGGDVLAIWKLTI